MCQELFIALCILSLFILTANTKSRSSVSAHSRGEKTEAQRGEITGSRRHASPVMDRMQTNSLGAVTARQSCPNLVQMRKDVPTSLHHSSPSM